jgi:hypothetical protein
MTDKRTNQTAASGNAQKDPDDWVTGDEPMTGAQRSYLKTLSEEAKQPFDDALTKAQASQRIEELQRITGRGTPAQVAPVHAAPNPADRSPARAANRSADAEIPQPSSAGEEDPEAALDDPEMRDAMESEARSVGAPGAAHAASTLHQPPKEK